MIIIIVIFICSTIYYIIRSKKITDLEFLILAIVFVSMLLFLNKNELKEHFAITGGSGEVDISTPTTSNKINIDKEKLFDIANKIIDKSIYLYEKSLQYIEKKKIKATLYDVTFFIKKKLSLLKKESFGKDSVSK